MKISPARAAAYEILLRIDRDRAFSSVLLPQYEAGLSEKDAALCHEIVLGALRRKLFLDANISQITGAKKLDLEVLTSLRIGAYQILELDRIPDHSAVNESVALVQRAKKTSAKGLVNAVLRRLTERKQEHCELDVGTRLSHPQWLLDRWSSEFGPDRALGIANANNKPPRLAFRITSEAPPPAGSVPSEIVDGAFTVSRMTRDLMQKAENGEVYFQDEASQLIASLVSIPPNGRFLDVCAAPGGKVSQVAIRHRAKEIAVVAGDLHHKRVEFLRENCVRQGANVEVVQYDAVQSLPFEAESFDFVLVDAPCSGTGTISSNPEIRYSLGPRDITELSRKQLAILDNASKLVKRGGGLYYSTCSLEKEENEDVMLAFLEEHGDFSVASSAVDIRFRTVEGFGRTFPDRDGTDGFFFAAIVKY